MSAICRTTTIWTGSTYPHRDFIKSIGGRWEESKNGWIVPPLSMRQREEIYGKTDGLKGITIAVYS